jgi:hypothetical protein
MTSGALSISDVARIFGSLFVDVVTSFLGPLLLELPLYWLIPSHSAIRVITREWILSILLAGGLGFLAYRTWQTRTARISWILFSLWFVFGVVVHLHVPNYPVSIASLWTQSGIECTGSSIHLDCRTFPLFTVPLLRGLSYSCGAVLAVRIYGSRFAPSPSRA